MIDKLDIQHAASILSKYLKAAKQKQNEKAEKEIKSIMQVIQDLFTIAIKYQEVKE